MKSIILGILASLFFASSFVLNRAMELGGGSWIWSAALRYLWMLPFLLAIVLLRGNFNRLCKHMKMHISKWLIWSTVGFGLFYAPLCFSAAYGPSWLVASTWQFTIIAGPLLAPFFYKNNVTKEGTVRVRQKIPYKSMGISSIILLGILIMQIEHAGSITIRELFYGIVPVLIASFAYPLGNRKMMALCDGKIDTYQRVLGMTLASMPFWMILSLFGLGFVGVPSLSQISQSLIVALSSGVVATLLFFKATDLTKGDTHQLAVVEATQSGEVIFALIGEIVVLGALLPSTLSLVGILFVIGGMLLHSIIPTLKRQKT